MTLFLKYKTPLKYKALLKYKAFDVLNKKDNNYNLLGYNLPCNLRGGAG